MQTILSIAEEYLPCEWFSWLHANGNVCRFKKTPVTVKSVRWWSYEPFIHKDPLESEITYPLEKRWAIIGRSQSDVKYMPQPQWWSQTGWMTRNAALIDFTTLYSLLISSSRKRYKCNRVLFLYSRSRIFLFERKELQQVTSTVRIFLAAR